MLGEGEAGDGEEGGGEGESARSRERLGELMNADAQRGIGVVEYGTGSVRYPGGCEFPAESGF